MPQYVLQYLFCYNLLCPTCSLVYTVPGPFGGNPCENIALTLPSLSPSLPPFLYFFTVDSSSSSDSEKESLGEYVDEEEEMGSDLEGVPPTPVG